MVSISHRARFAPFSPVRKLAPLIKSAKDSGVKVHEVNIGQPDTHTNEIYYQAIKEFNQQPVSYEPSSGSRKLKSAWSEFFDRVQNIKVDPDLIITTAGGSEGLLYSIAAISDPGDEIIVFEPTYANYIGIAEMLGIKLIGVPTSFHDNFQPPGFDEIQKFVTPKTKGILFCNPGNPSGVIINENFIKDLVDWAKNRSLWVISDECYRELVFSRGPLKSLCAYNQEHIIVVDSISKRASLCGSRIGCVIATNKSVREAIASFASQRISISSVEQYASSAVIASLTKESLLTHSELFHQRAKSFLEGLKPFPEIAVGKPEGAFYTIIEFSVGKSEDFAEYLLAKFRQGGETVCITPAIGFYLNTQYGIRQARVALVLEEKLMKRVGNIIGEGYRAFQSEVLNKVS